MLASLIFHLWDEGLDPGNILMELQANIIANINANIIANILKYLELCEDEWLKPESITLCRTADEIITKYVK